MFLFLRILVLLFFLGACSPSTRITRTDSKVYPLGTQGFDKVDSTVLMSLLPYKNNLDSIMEVVIANSGQVMEKGQPEGLLGNFVADLALEQGKKKYDSAMDDKGIDFCFLNNGGLRSSLPAGQITRRKIFELMPFENELIVLTLDGATTLRLLDFIANKGGMPVSGVRFNMKNKKAIDIFIGSKMFDSTATYRVVTSDYLANGGDNLSFLAEITRKQPLSLKLRDAIILHMEEKNRMNQTIRVSLDNRIAYAK